jgi:hypothetical protein
MYGRESTSKSIGVGLLLALIPIFASPATAGIDGPTTPTNVAAEVGASSVRLDWAPSTSDSEIAIYFVKVNGNWHWTDKTSINLYLRRSTTYRVEIQAQDTSYLRSAWSNPIEFTTPDIFPVTTPGDVRASSPPGTVTVDWDPSTSDARILDYVVTLDGGHNGAVSKRTSDTHAAFDVPSGGDFVITVKGRDLAYRWSEPSAPVVVRVEPSEDWRPPSPPTNLRASFDAEGRVRLLSWDASTGGVGTVTYSVIIVEYNNTPIETTSDLSVELLEFGRCPANQLDTLTFVVTATANGVVSPPSEPLTLCFA